MKKQARSLSAFTVIFFMLCIKVWSQPGCVGFTADFNFAKDTTSYFPININFTNTSLWTDSTTQYRWTYGNGDTVYIKEDNYIYTASGTYNVCLLAANIKQNGDTTCRDTACKQVVISIDSCIRPVANINSAKIDPDSCFGYMFTSNTVGYYNYLWSFGDGTDTDILNPSHRYASKGIYTVCFKAYYLYKNNLECADSICADIDVCHNLSASAIKNRTGISVYPHPFSSTLEIEYTDIPGTLVITDISGKTVYTQSVAGPAVLNLSHLQNGVYFLSLSQADGIAHRQKIVKQ